MEYKATRCREKKNMYFLLTQTLRGMALMADISVYMTA